MQKNHIKSLQILLLGVLALVVFFTFAPSKKAPKSVDKISTPPIVAAKEIEEILTVEEEFPHVVKKNIPLYVYLKELGASSVDIIEMVEATKPTKDLSRLSLGTRFQVVQDSEQNLEEIKFRFSPLEKLYIKKVDNLWQAEVIKEVVDIELSSFVGNVNSSLWESATDAEMDQYLILAMAEIFGWEIDFNREVRLHDKWRITAEKKLVKGEHVGWGSVLAAEYINQGTSYKAVLFRHKNEDIGYYNLEGENLRKMFLKSPLKFGRVTSRFNKRRFHPKLKRIRPHNGVDYGAPIGTPVRSVANGAVTFAGRSGGGGKVMKVRHNSTYKTAYKHLSRYAVKKGAKVKQGQIIAYTGNTGLSTGPHLHYEFLVNGRFRDPLKQKFPSAEPISKKHKEAFLRESKEMIATLPPWIPENSVMIKDSEPETNKGS